MWNQGVTAELVECDHVSQCSDMAEEAIQLLKMRLEVEKISNSMDRAKGAVSWKLEFFAHVNKYKSEYHEKGK